MQLNKLTFSALALASHTRAQRWHGARDTLRPTVPGYGWLGWSLGEWMTATLGELGEAANIIKKLNRHRDGMVGNKHEEKEADLRAALAEELADTAIYLDLLAQACGVDLGTEIIAKFNKVSIKNDFPERLGEHGQG